MREEGRQIFPVRVMRAFARAKPWRGTPGERQKKFEAMHKEMCGTYGFKGALEFVNIHEGADSLNSHLPPRGEVTNIALVGKMSVITYLYLFAAAQFQLQDGEERRPTAMAWTLACFKKFFPLSASRLVEAGGCYFKPGEVPERLSA